MAKTCFRADQSTLLVCTAFSARGMDVTSITPRVIKISISLEITFSVNLQEHVILGIFPPEYKVLHQCLWSKAWKVCLAPTRW